MDMYIVTGIMFVIAGIMLLIARLMRNVASVLVASLQIISKMYDEMIKKEKSK